MARRDADGGWPKRPASARCVSPAGASPASVSAGAPSSRPQASGGVFEADFLPVSYGFRPQRSATAALETLRKLGAKGHHVLDADIRDYFGSIDHGKLMKLVERRISDRRGLKLVRQGLRAGGMEEGRGTGTAGGAPQGGGI